MDANGRKRAGIGSVKGSGPNSHVSDIQVVRGVFVQIFFYRQKIRGGFAIVLIGKGNGD
jgi:hypothetical protein